MRELSYPATRKLWMNAAISAICVVVIGNFGIP